MASISVKYSSEMKSKADRIWGIMTDIEAWPQWQGTPFIKPRTPLPLKEGSIFEAKLGGIKWELTVTKAEKPQKLTWVGKAPGLKAIHDWEFQEKKGKTLVTTKESISGLMATISSPLVKRSLQRIHTKWLADLKTQAEGS